MLKRSAFKIKVPAKYVRPDREAKPNGVLSRPFNGAVISREVSTIAKLELVRSEAYRRLVALMPCIHCGIVGHSQAAHADMGKGGRIKSDDRTCYPACCARPDGSIGCHSLIGATGTFTREERRELEAKYAVRTRQAIRRMGLWPIDMPHMEEQIELSLMP